MSKIIYSIPSWDNWISLTTLRKFIDQTEHLDGSEKIRLVNGALQIHLDPSKLEKLTPKNGKKTGVHLHFEAGEYITKPGTPVTTKIDQPRDHLGRFVKRK